MFAYDFMRYAFLASTFIAITCGIVGVYVVARGFSFLAHTLSEIGFAGAALQSGLVGFPYGAWFSSPCLVQLALVNYQ